MLPIVLVVIVLVGFMAGAGLGSLLKEEKRNNVLNTVSQHQTVSTATTPIMAEKLNLDLEYRLVPYLDVKVERNGEIVQRRTQLDPPTRNFVRLISLLFYPDRVVIGSPALYTVDVVDENGNTQPLGMAEPYTGYQHEEVFNSVPPQLPRFYVLLGNGVPQEDPFTAYRLTNEVARFPVAPETQMMFNGTHFIIELGGSWTATLDATITEAGLLGIFEKFDRTDDNYVNALLFYTPLEQPIFVVQNDTVIVTYRIVVGKFFTENMARVFRIIFSGDNAYSGETVKDITGADIPVGVENKHERDIFCYGGADVVRIVVGNGMPSQDIRVYSLSHQIASIPPQFQYIEGTDTIQILLYGSFIPTENTTITEVGVIFPVERNDVYDDGDRKPYIYILAVYTPLDSPIPVTANVPTEIAVKITINIGGSS